MEILHHCNVETALSALIEHGAALVVLEFKQHMPKHIFQVLGIDAVVVFIRFKPHPAKVERGAIHVARSLRSLFPRLAHSLYALSGPQGCCTA